MRYLMFIFLVMLSACDPQEHCDDVLDQALNCFVEGFPAMIFPIDEKSVSVVCMEDVVTQPIDLVKESGYDYR